MSYRGIEDTLIASVDGLTGFPEAINSIFPETEVQLCIIHQIRNSMKYVEFNFIATCDIFRRLVR